MKLALEYQPISLLLAAIAVGVYIYIKGISLPKINYDMVFAAVIAIVVYENICFRRNEK